MGDDVEFHVEDDPDPLDIEFLERQIRLEASAALGLGEERELAIFVREGDRIVAGISGWTWGDCCELQSLWVDPSLRGRWLGARLVAAAEAEATARGCTQTIHFTWGFQAQPLYKRRATSWWAEWRTSRLAPTSSGTASGWRPECRAASLESVQRALDGRWGSSRSLAAIGATLSSPRVPVQRRRFPWQPHRP